MAIAAVRVRVPLRAHQIAVGFAASSYFFRRLQLIFLPSRKRPYPHTIMSLPKMPRILLSMRDPYDGFPAERPDAVIMQDQMQLNWYDRDDGSSSCYGDFTMPEIPVGMVPQFPERLRRRYLPPTLYEIQTNFIIPHAHDTDQTAESDLTPLPQPVTLRPQYADPDEGYAIAAEPGAESTPRLQTRRLPALIDQIDTETDRVWVSFGPRRPRGWVTLSRMPFRTYMYASVCVTIARDRNDEDGDVYIIDIAETESCPHYLKRTVYDIITMCSYPPEHPLSGCYDLLDRVYGATRLDGDDTAQIDATEAVRTALQKLSATHGQQFTAEMIYGPHPDGQNYAEYATLQNGLQIPGYVLRKCHIPASWNGRLVDIELAYNGLRGWQPVAVYPRKRQSQLV